MNNSEEALEVIYDRALDLVANKRLKDGEELLEKIHKAGNVNIDILNILGIINYLYCNFEEAKKYWNESLEISYENNKALEFINDINGEEFSFIKDRYIKSLILIENKNYLEAINLLEDIGSKRKELIEIKEILCLLYMIINNNAKAFENISNALECDNSNYRIKSIYYAVKKDLEEIKGTRKENTSLIELTSSEVVLNLIMILNYKINSFYEEELDYKNDEINKLVKKLELSNLEIENLKKGNKEEVK